MDLPRDVQMCILGFLDAVSLSMAARVCKLWRTLSGSSALWKALCAEEGAFQLENGNSKPLDYKELFIERVAPHLLAKMYAKCRSIHMVRSQLLM